MSSAGTAADADCPLSSDLIEWADLIVVMERRQEKQLSQKFSAFLAGKKIVNLGIPDVYGWMQPELIKILRERESRWLR